MECIVLAGGLGTRLQSVVEDVPKCMAPVNGHPFLHYVFNYLEQQGCNRVILSLGYKHQYILDWLKTEQRSFEVDHVIEETPLGTGGGMQLAIKKSKEENVFVLNGDTMFSVELNAMQDEHTSSGAATTLALKTMFAFDRYGSVKTNTHGTITEFEEKQYKDEGLINGGIYLVNREYLLDKNLPEKFSFEKDYLEAFVPEHKFHGHISDGYFIDIGIPEDYYRAQTEFKNK